MTKEEIFEYVKTLQSILDTNLTMEYNDFLRIVNNDLFVYIEYRKNNKKIKFSIEELK